MLVPAGHAALVGTVNSVVVAADPVEIVDFVVPVEIVVAAVPETAAVVVPGIVGAVVLGIADRPGGRLEGHGNITGTTQHQNTSLTLKS